MNIDFLRIPKNQRDIIQKASEQEKILLPTIAIWEISMLVSKNRISLNLPCKDWIKEALKTPGIITTDLSPEIAYEANFLPEGFHNDPADRIMVATARILKIPLLTHDKKILNYAKKGHLETIEI